VREYWIVDPDRRTVDVFVWREGAFAALGQWGVGDEARSEVLSGFAILVADLFGA